MLYATRTAEMREATKNLKPCATILKRENKKLKENSKREVFTMLGILGAITMAVGEILVVVLTGGK